MKRWMTAKRWMTTAVLGLAVVSVAPVAHARSEFAPHAKFEAAPTERARGFGIEHGRHFARDGAGLRGRFLPLSPIVPCNPYNPWVSVPPYPMTCG